MRDLISLAGAEVAEHARREWLLRDWNLGQSQAMELTKYSLAREGAAASEMGIYNDIAVPPIECAAEDDLVLDSTCALKCDV